MRVPKRPHHVACQKNRRTHGMSLQTVIVEKQAAQNLATNRAAITPTPRQNVSLVVSFQKKRLHAKWIQYRVQHAMYVHCTESCGQVFCRSRQSPVLSPFLGLRLPKYVIGLVILAFGSLEGIRHESLVLLPLFFFFFSSFPPSSSAFPPPHFHSKIADPIGRSRHDNMT